MLSGHAVALKRLGAILLAGGQIDDGEHRYREALALDEELVARHPENARYRFDLSFSLSDLAFAARKKGDPATARTLWTRALDIRQAALDADPRNVRAMRGVASVHGYLAAAAADLKMVDEQLAHRRASLRQVEAVVAVVGAQTSDVTLRTWGQVHLAAAAMDKAEMLPVPERAPFLEEASQALKLAEPSVQGLARRADSDPELETRFERQSARLQGLR